MNAASQATIRTRSRNPARAARAVGESRIEELGILCAKPVFLNLQAARLCERAIQRGEGRLSRSGALAVETGKHTGRSPEDKFIVRDERTENAVCWKSNAAIGPERFETLRNDMIRHASERELYVQDLYAGADPERRASARIVTELAWHSLFIRNLLIRPEANQLETFRSEILILDLPSFKADPERHGCGSQTVIACDFDRKTVLIGGTQYAGEMKKSVFTLLNFLLPEKGAMPMHCSANVGDAGDVALFFGLSGTGKTTLSADPKRALIGDDEHGWSEEGIFNVEGGCYAKTHRLRRESEPQIHDAAIRFGSVLENVTLSAETREPDFDDSTLTENARCAYPLEFMKGAAKESVAGHPRHILFLSADAFGVLPPASKLTPEQAVYYFLSGYTAKIAGTETGISEPEATFSTCFGAPFMPRPASEYGKLLGERIAEHEAQCWLVNTGWSGGPVGIGSRMPLAATRAIIDAILSNRLEGAQFRIDENFGFRVPLSVEGVEDSMLDPRSTWSDPGEYDKQAKRLAAMFVENFAQHQADAGEKIRAAAPVAA